VLYLLRQRGCYGKVPAGPRAADGAAVIRTLAATCAAIDQEGMRGWCACAFERADDALHCARCARPSRSTLAGFAVQALAALTGRATLTREPGSARCSEITLRTLTLPKSGDPAAR
jgi:hypothetical protein